MLCRLGHFPPPGCWPSTLIPAPSLPSLFYRFQPRPACALSLSESTPFLPIRSRSWPRALIALPVVCTTQSCPQYLKDLQFPLSRHFSISFSRTSNRPGFQHLMILNTLPWNTASRRSGLEFHAVCAIRKVPWRISACAYAGKDLPSGARMTKWAARHTILSSSWRPMPTRTRVLEVSMIMTFVGVIFNYVIVK